MNSRCFTVIRDSVSGARDQLTPGQRVAGSSNVSRPCSRNRPTSSDTTDLPALAMIESLDGVQPFH